MDSDEILTMHEDLKGQLHIPEKSKILIIFAHGSGSNRFSKRNRFLANYLNERGYATLLVDLLNDYEKRDDIQSGHLQYDLTLLTERLIGITNWIIKFPKTEDMTIGYFGSSTGAAAAVNAASRFQRVKCVICRSGRTDLIEEDVCEVFETPILFIVGKKDQSIVQFNKKTMKEMHKCRYKNLILIPGASHYFEESNTMVEVAKTVSQWLEICLVNSAPFVYSRSSVQRVVDGICDRINSRFFSIKFRDRYAAAEILLKLLKKFDNEHKIGVVAIPRGGIPIAKLISNSLSEGFFNILTSRRLRSPYSSEITVGSILQDGYVHIDRDFTLPLKYLEMEIEYQRLKLEIQKSLLRVEKEHYNLENKTIILVDDGAYSGSTLYNACRWIKKHNPLRIIIAVPVISRKAFNILNDCDVRIEYICMPKTFFSVEHYYQDFSLPRGEDLLNLLSNRNN